MTYFGFNTGQLLSWFALGHITKFGYAAFALSSWAFLWAWRWRRPVKGYKYYPTDCDLQDSVYHKQAGFHWPRCALEIEE